MSDLITMTAKLNIRVIIFNRTNNNDNRRLLMFVNLQSAIIKSKNTDSPSYIQAVKVK